MNQEATVSPDAETQNPAPVIDEAPKEQPEVVTPEADAPEAKAEADKPEESEESKALKRMQRRIDKRTADVYRERAEKDQLAQRLAQLEAKDEGEKPPANFEEAVRQRAREIAHAETFNAKCNAVWEAGQKLEGFSESAKALAEEAPLFDRSGRPTDILKVILESDNPAGLMHHLGKNPDVAADLADLSPTQMARRLDRIEREMSAPPKTSKAPAPIEPIAASKSPNHDLASADFRTYEQMRKKQGARWAR